MSRSSLDGRLLCGLLEVVVVGEHLVEGDKLTTAVISTKITPNQPEPPWRGSQSEESEELVCLPPSSYRNLLHILQSFRPGFLQPESHRHETIQQLVKSILKVEEFGNRE